MTHKKMFFLMMGAAFLLPFKKGMAQDVPPMIIKATTIFTPPDNGDDPNPPQETNTVIYVKGAHIKSESKSETQHNIVIIDRDAKKTTQLYEQGGRKYGYFSVDTANHTPRVRTDSAGNPLPRPRTNIDYQDSSKVIAGLNCKKAVATTNFGGRTLTTIIWYTKDLPLKQPLPTGGRFNMGGMSQLDGFPVAYTITLPNGAVMQYQISKVDQNANINDNTFDIPKGYDLKPESERPQFQPGGGGFRALGGGGPGGGGPGGGGPQ
jgi:hypothetical protein